MEWGLIATWWLASGLFALAIAPAGCAIGSAEMRLAVLLHARTLGMVLVLTPVWLAGHFGIPVWTPAGIGFSLLAWLTGSVLAVLRAGWTLRRLPGLPRQLVVSEAVFAGLFLLGCVTRSLSPETFGNEKLPDLALLTACQLTETFPVMDPWYAGSPVNYYDFGHILIAGVAKLASTPPWYAFPLGTALTWALLGQAAFGLAGVFTPRSSSGLMAVVLVCFAGNLGVFHSGPLDWLTPTRAIEKIVGGTLVDTCITEFPAWTFLSGELHAYNLAAPFFLAALAMAASWGMAGRSLPYRGLPWIIVFGVFSGAVPMIDAWEAPLTGAAILLASVWRARRFGAAELLRGGAVCLVAAATVQPFLRTYEAPVSGIAILPAIHRTELQDMLTQYGLAMWVIPVFALAVAVENWRIRRQPAFATAKYGALLLAGAAFFLVALMEVLYLDTGFFTGARLRWMTVGKLGYEVWLLLGVAVSVALNEGMRSTGWPRSLRFLWLAGSMLILVDMLAFVPRGIGLRSPALGAYERTLDSRSYVRRQYPADLAAAEFVETHIPRSHVVLEATGDPYSTIGRISAMSGRPTVLGWEHHQRLWRNNRAGEVLARRADVDRAYRSASLDEFREIAARYRVRWVLVGRVERILYPAAGLAKFDALGPPVWQGGDTAIYLVRSTSE